MSETMTLQECREKIDLLDKELVELLKQRMTLSANVAKAKAATGKAVRDPAREQAILQKVSELAGPEFRTEARILFSTLFSLSRSRQKHLLRSEPGILLQEIQEAMVEKPEAPEVACSAADFPIAGKLFPHPILHETENPEDAVANEECFYGLVPEDEFTDFLPIVGTVTTTDQRYICFAQEAQIFPDADRIRLMLSLPDKPGELNRLLARFTASDLNLKKLCSFPLENGEAGFQIEFQGSARQAKVAELLDTLEGDAEKVIFLGSHREF